MIVLTKGACFTNKQAGLTMEVHSIDQNMNTLSVKVEKGDCGWFEDWNLQHTIWGFERGEYQFSYKESGEVVKPLSTMLRPEMINMKVCD